MSQQSGFDLETYLGDPWRAEREARQLREMRKADEMTALVALYKGRAALLARGGTGPRKNPAAPDLRPITKRLVRRRCQGRCEQCGDLGPYDHHHLHYRTEGWEAPEDIRALCRECHFGPAGKLKPLDDPLVYDPLGLTQGTTRAVKA